MLLLLLVVACIPSGGISLTENEWRDEMVRIYSKFSKYMNPNQPVKFADLFSDDAEGLYPRTAVVGKDGLARLEHQYDLETNFEDVYIGMTELLYNTPEVAVTRHVGYESKGPGHKGLMISLADDEDRVRIKMDIFNHN